MRFFRKNKDAGILLFRLFIGARLLYGVLDNVFSWSRMQEFVEFLQLFHFPMPSVLAVVSVYAQAIAGIFILLGSKIRWASLLIILNFLVALLVVHRRDSFEQITPALSMLFGSLLFLFTGAGKYSLDREPL